MTLEQALYPRAYAAPLGVDIRGDEAPNPNQSGNVRRKPMTPEEVARYDLWLEGVVKIMEARGTIQSQTEAA